MVKCTFDKGKISVQFTEELYNNNNKEIILYLL